MSTRDVSSAIRPAVYIPSRIGNPKARRMAFSVCVHYPRLSDEPSVIRPCAARDGEQKVEVKNGKWEVNLENGNTKWKWEGWHLSSTVVTCNRQNSDLHTYTIHLYTSGNVKHCWRAGATQLGIFPRCSGCITCHQQHTDFLPEARQIYLLPLRAYCTSKER